MSTYFSSGRFATKGIECMVGSAMYLMQNGMPKSHTRMDLSSDVVTKRLHWPGGTMRLSHNESQKKRQVCSEKGALGADVVGISAISVS